MWYHKSYKWQGLYSTTYLSLKMADKPKASYNEMKRTVHVYPRELSLKIRSLSVFISKHHPDYLFLQHTFLTTKINEK
jgi:hypothetical protein